MAKQVKKDQSIIIRGIDPKNLKIKMGLGLVKKQSSPTLDLDASCILFDNKGKHFDTISFMNSKSKCRGVAYEHNASGESQIGMAFDLGQLTTTASHIAVILHSFTGRSFHQVSEGICHIHSPSGKALCQFRTDAGGRHKGLYIGSLSQKHHETGERFWRFTAKSEQIYQLEKKQMVQFIQKNFREGSAADI